LKKAAAIQSAANKRKKPTVANYLSAIKPKEDE